MVVGVLKRYFYTKFKPKIRDFGAVTWLVLVRFVQESKKEKIYRVDICFSRCSAEINNHRLDSSYCNSCLCCGYNSNNACEEKVASMSEKQIMEG